MEESITERKFSFQSTDWPSGSESLSLTCGRMPFGDRLKTLREVARLSQAELGDAIESSGPTISRWEAGGGGPSLKQAVMLADALGVDLETLAYENPPFSATHDLSYEERAVLDAFHAHDLDLREALRRLASDPLKAPAPEKPHPRAGIPEPLKPPPRRLLRLDAETGDPVVQRASDTVGIQNLTESDELRERQENQQAREKAREREKENRAPLPAKGAGGKKHGKSGR